MIVRDPETTAVVLALASVGKIGPVKLRTIFSQAAQPTDILHWTMEQFCAVPGIQRELAGRIIRKLDIDYGHRLIEWAGKNGYEIITIVDSDYPASLREQYDPPPFLFVAGTVTAADQKAVAIVGSRNASEYGRTTASTLAGELCRYGVTIVSGLAIGVDTSSHRGAIDAGGRTIAVLGSGIDVIYPPENRGLYRQISDHGAVISEFFPGVEPSPGHFPRRNRVIAGLVQAVVVVEAGTKSGALVTADITMAQGKPLFAVPGNLGSRMSKGTNELIKSGAHLLTSIEDIFSLLPQLKNDYIGPVKAAAEGLTEGEQVIYNCLSDKPLQIDTLVRLSGLSVSGVSSYLLSLELRGCARQISGKRFIAV